MKKMKGGAVVAMESSHGIYASAYEDARTRLKHESLLQDYEDLDKETEASRRKLLTMRQKKLTLVAEVRFLRRRYKYLTENHADKTPVNQNLVQPRNLLTGSKCGKKDRNHKLKDALLWHPEPQFDSNEKGKFHYEGEVVLENSALISKLKQKQRPNSRMNKAGLPDSIRIPGLNGKEKICGGKEATVRINTRSFDLNEISREEEELQANDEGARIEEPKISSMRNGNDEHNDMRLIACRNIRNGSVRGGKRKISWQYPVALSV
uniref:Uncharacterized protein n=1 Tax=Rhizophora mucronata TaxID=61149 RepID=A0A2P2LZW3_RHIMU